MPGVLDGWAPGAFTAAGYTRSTYRKGCGPGVIVIHEVPGITPAVARFADDVVAAGFTVVMPSLFGTPGKPLSAGYGFVSLAKLCVAGEFTTWATKRTSPIISWLRALARHMLIELGGPGVGAVGMCFSGGFALAMMVDDVMVAPVLSQPSTPLAIGPGGRSRGGDLNLSPDDAVVVARRAREGCQVLGLRYDRDPLVGPRRFTALGELLGEAFIAVELPSRDKHDHSVLTEQRDEASVQRVIDFLAEKLRS